MEEAHKRVSDLPSKVSSYHDSSYTFARSWQPYCRQRRSTEHYRLSITRCHCIVTASVCSPSCDCSPTMISISGSSTAATNMGTKKVRQPRGGVRTLSRTILGHHTEVTHYCGHRLNVVMIRELWVSTRVQCRCGQMGMHLCGVNP